MVLSNRFERRLFPHFFSSSIKKVSKNLPGSRRVQFKALPFGISSVPWLFTKIFKQIAVILRNRNISIHQYLDDWLNKQWSLQESLRDRESTLQICQQRGCIINFDKSDLEPTQKFVFVGIQFDLKEDLVRPAEEKWSHLECKVMVFLQNKLVPAQSWESLLGLLNQLEEYVPWRKIHIRPIQYNLHHCYSSKNHPHHHPVPVWQQTIIALQWWINKDNFFRGLPIHLPQYQYGICTDTSMEGLGAHLGQSKIYGSWSQLEKSFHINRLEMTAVRLALVKFELPGL